MSHLHIKGELLVEGLQAWFKKDLVDGASSSGDFGKFFFSVSSASIGSILAITKLGNITQDGIFLYSALLLYLFSIIVSIILVYPRYIKANDDTDLFIEYDKQLRKIRYCLVIWFSLWSFGTISAVLSLMVR